MLATAPLDGVAPSMLEELAGSLNKFALALVMRKKSSVKQIPGGAHIAAAFSDTTAFCMTDVGTVRPQALAARVCVHWQARLTGSYASEASLCFGE